MDRHNPAGLIVLERQINHDEPLVWRLHIFRNEDIYRGLDFIRVVHPGGPPIEVWQEGNKIHLRAWWVANYIIPNEAQLHRILLWLTRPPPRPLRQLAQVNEIQRNNLGKVQNLMVWLVFLAVVVAMLSMIYVHL